MKPIEIVLSVILCLGVLVAPSPSNGQQPEKVYGIGILFSGLPTPATRTQGRNREAMIDGLRERGYIEGQNLVIYRRYTEGQEKRAPSLAAELVSLKPDLIVADGSSQVRAVQQASSTIPIVMFGVIEPVRKGRNLQQHPDHGFFDFLRWRFGGGPKDPGVIPPGGLPEFLPPVVAPDLNSINHPDPDSIQVTWIGNATFMIQVNGLTILTDPMFSERASPVSFAGPKRLALPGVSLNDLPKIDAVIISHNHYDHLDADSVKAIGDGPRYFVPLGFSPWSNSRGINNVQELDWWDSAELRGLRFHAVPAQHFSGRTPFDRNKMLWSGWVIETRAGKIYFSGCTGYAPLFQEIGNRLGPMRFHSSLLAGTAPDGL